MLSVFGHILILQTQFCSIVPSPVNKTPTTYFINFRRKKSTEAYFDNFEPITHHLREINKVLNFSNLCKSSMVISHLPSVSYPFSELPNEEKQCWVICICACSQSFSLWNVMYPNHTELLWCFPLRFFPSTCSAIFPVVVVVALQFLNSGKPDLEDSLKIGTNAPVCLHTQNLKPV